MKLLKCFSKRFILRELEGSRTISQSSLIFFLSQAQLEKMVTKLKVEKAQVESSLREEEAKCGMLLREVKDANEVSTDIYFVYNKTPLI